MGIIKNEGMNNYHDEFNDYDGHITIELRGNSSQFNPKKPYRIETVDSQGNNNNVSLLGMPEENDWVLYAPWQDKTLIRNVLIYHLSNQMGRYASRTKFCELFLNGEYRGVYVLMEKLKRDNNRIDISTLNENEVSGDDLTGGYILKFDWAWTGDNNGGFHSVIDGMYYNYHYPKPDEITEVQEDYIQNFIYSFESLMDEYDYDDIDNGYSNLTNIPSFVDFIMLQEFAKNVDAYRLSSYIYKDKNSIDGRLTAGPIWDFNHGFGNCDYGWTWEPENWLLEYEPTDDPISFWWERIWEDEYFQSLFNSRWHELRQSLLSNENLELTIENLILELGESIEDNFIRWPILDEYVWPNYHVFGTYEEEVDYLKNWIFDRAEWMDSQVQFILGDLNGDGIVNILDVIQTINIILYNGNYNHLADINMDEYINILDIVQLIDIILNQ